MFQNIKVDVIYHNTNTDFEMEFNLCGCCRMRLLTDKTPDKKALVHSLARAVSRSRIIIVVGGLFGEDGTVSLVGEAIKCGVSTIDNNIYGIKASENVTILKGSTPLITNEGFFGGCIIESGPQTMILLSKSKSIRKTVLSSLIHPYIEELYASGVQDEHKDYEQPKEASNTENTSSLENWDSENINEELENKSEEAADLVAKDVMEANNEVEEEEAASEKAEDSYVELGQNQPENTTEDKKWFDIFAMKNKSVNKEEDYEDINSSSYDDDDDEYFEPRSVNDRGFKLPVLIISILLLVLLAVLAYCIFYVPSTEGIPASQYIKDIFGTLFPNGRV